MKKALLASFLILSSLPSLAAPYLSERTYYGETEDRKSCWIEVREVFNDRSARVKSSFDSFFSKGFVLKPIRDGRYYFTDVVGNSGTAVEIDFDQNGEVKYLMKSVMTEMIITYGVSTSICRVKR